MDLRGSETEITRLAKDGLKIVSAEQGEKLAQDLGIDTYVECSALTQDGLTDVFEWAARLSLAPTNPPAGIGQRKTISRSFRAKFKRPCELL